MPRTVPFLRLNPMLTCAMTGFRPWACEFVLTERAAEESAFVLSPLDIDDERALQFGFGKNHGSSGPGHTIHGSPGRFPPNSKAPASQESVGPGLRLPMRRLKSFQAGIFVIPNDDFYSSSSAPRPS